MNSPREMTMETLRSLSQKPVSVLRVYNDGSRVEKTIPIHEAATEVSYNMLRRPGCAVFVNGLCVQEGYLSKERCMDITYELFATKGTHT